MHKLPKFSTLLILLVVIGVGCYFLYSKYRSQIYFYLNRNKVSYELNNNSGTSNFESLTITQHDLDTMIIDNVVGKGVGDDTIMSADAEILDGKIEFVGMMSGGTKVNATVVMSENKRDVVVEELTLSESGVLANVKETLFKNFLKAALENLIKQGDDSGYQMAEFKEGGIVIYFSN